MAGRRCCPCIRCCCTCCTAASRWSPRRRLQTCCSGRSWSGRNTRRSARAWSSPTRAWWGLSCTVTTGGGLVCRFKGRRLPQPRLCRNKAVPVSLWHEQPHLLSPRAFAVIDTIRWPMPFFFYFFFFMSRWSWLTFLSGPYFKGCTVIVSG